jgi:hypothetical protein
VHISIVSFNVNYLIGEVEWDMRWKVVKKDAECFGCRRIWGRGASRASITYSNNRAAILEYEGVIEPPCYDAALACDRGCFRVQMPVYITLLLLRGAS